MNKMMMNRRQALSLGLGSAAALALAACGGSKESAAPAEGDAAAIKVGLICLHDENSTYDLNFINGFKEAMANLGIGEDSYMIKTNIPEGQECYDAAAEFADAGCKVIFADSFGHEDYNVVVSRDYLTSSDRVLLIDDFLANGQALNGLIDLCKQAGAELVGVAIAIEKCFSGAGDRLRAQGMHVESLALIESMTENEVIFRS